MEDLKGKYLVTKKVTVEHIYDEIVGVYRLGDLFNVEFANGSSRIYTGGEIEQLLSNTDDNQAYISDTIGCNDSDAKIYVQLSEAEQ